MKPQLHISQEEWELIDNYLQGNMPPNELVDFEMKMNKDDKLKDKVHEVRLLLVGVQERALELQLNQFHQELNGSTKKKARIFSFTKLLLAAAIIVVIAVGTWFLVDRLNPGERMFSRYYKPDPGLVTAMSASDDYAFERAMVDYKTGDYKQALDAWQKLAAIRSSDTLSYFIASCYLSLDQPAQAIEHYKQVLAMPGSYFNGDAHWYMGLALLQQGKKAEAIPFIQRSEHTRKQELLKELHEE